ncbi:Uma2 family endonuclease [Streptacidiphilus sp. MAP12-16]|uniref:Uma2 family endonuclease n=1 Tax=Streptacidiphilus sp. MAP12-16 TaxID=3156300 RepID=UPI00351690CC
MSVLASMDWVLPEAPYDMWARGELAEYLHLPKDGTRVEIVGGVVSVSPGPDIDHAAIVSDIQEGLIIAKVASADFPWRALQGTDLNLIEIGDGYIPDLTVLHHEILTKARASRAKHVFPYQLQLAVEVTSPSNARKDREPVVGKEQRLTKWSGYARTGVQWYLLVDRDPRSLGITLYAEPDQGTGRYQVHSTWKFGEAVMLPEPLNFRFTTELWQPWAD